MTKLRKSGISLSNSPAMARAEAANYAASVKNRTLTSEMRTKRAATNRQLLAGQRLQAFNGSNVEIALPKIRQPLSTLADKGIPFNIEDDRELKEIRRWARLFYVTHDLVPLLIDIYSKFPCVGLEFDAKDPEIKDFYEELFFNQLNYQQFLPDSLGREYYISGEVTAFAHFSESLGSWASEEILNPDYVSVSKSLFSEDERVQLRVKEIVEMLKSGPDGGHIVDSEIETPSERLERTHEYSELARYYPEFIQAAAQDDGLDLSDALVSRIVNKSADWHLRGTPHLLRSFRTLMMEESLNAAQDAVADRLYSPFILATLGIEDLGDGTPWIPTSAELEESRDDFQTALMGDFRLMVHNFGLKVESVFGRESVPRFDQDYDRIDKKLLQAWGIGESLISGGTAQGGAYASSALNREFVTQMMVTFQNQAKAHIQKRMELVAEAQGHFDYELKGSYRRPIYREIIEYDPETGKEYIRKVPKLLIPEVKFSTLNLRDEAQEREFMQSLKDAGVPISDKKLSVSIDIDFTQELERASDELVQKGLAQAQAMKKLQQLCDKDGLPYPEDLAMYLGNTLMLRQQLAGVEGIEQQNKQMEQAADQASPAGQMGLLPGTVPLPPPPPDGEGGGDDGPMAMVANFPSMMSPNMSQPGVEESETKQKRPIEVPRNRIRPPESDEHRGTEPKAAGKRSDKFKNGPSTYKASYTLPKEEVERHLNRFSKLSSHRPNGDLDSLIHDPGFWQIVNMPQYEGQVLADWAEIQAGGAEESRDLLQEALEMYEEMYGIYIPLPA